MKLSSRTVELLKNFATINQGMLFTKGKRLKTMSIMRNGFAQVEIEEEIPQRFAIYSLPELLGVLSMFSQPEIEIKDTHLLITQGKNTVKYFYSAENIIVFPPEDKEIKLPSEDATLTLAADELSQITKAAAIMKFDMIGISKNGIRAFLDKTSDSTSNVFKIDVAVETDATDEFKLKIDNLKIIPGDYEVAISEKGICRFTSVEDSSLIYYIPLEKK